MTALVSVEPGARAGTEIQLRAGKAKGQEKRRVLRVSLVTPVLLGHWNSCLARSGAVCDLLPVFVGPFFPTAINRASQFIVCVCSAEQSGVIGFVLAPEILLPESVFTLLCTLERGGGDSTQFLCSHCFLWCFGQLLDFVDSRKCPSSCIPHLHCRVPAAGAVCSPARCLAAADLLFCIFI